MTGKDPSFGSVGFHQLLFTIQEITAGYAYGTDNFNVNRKIPVGIQRAKGAAPLAGEQWLLTKDLGPWTFAAIMNNPSEASAAATVTIVNGGIQEEFPNGTYAEAVLEIQWPEGTIAGPGLVAGPFTGGYSSEPGLEELDSVNQVPTANDGGIGYAVLNLDSTNKIISGDWSWVYSFFDTAVEAYQSPQAARGLEANAEMEGTTHFVNPSTDEYVQSYAVESSGALRALASLHQETEADYTNFYEEEDEQYGSASFGRSVNVETWDSEEATAFINEYFEVDQTGDSAASFGGWQIGAGYNGENATTVYVAASLYPNNGISWFVLGQYPDGVPAYNDNYILGQPSVAIINESNDAALFVVGQDASSVPYVDDPSAGNTPAIYRGAVAGEPGTGDQAYSNIPFYPGSVWPDITEGAPGIWVADTTETPYFIGSAGQLPVYSTGAEIDISAPAINLTQGAEGTVSAGIFIATGSDSIGIVSESSNIDINAEGGNVVVEGYAGVYIHGQDHGGVHIGENASDDIGFFGATAVAQQSSSGITTVADLVTILQNYGLLS